VDYENKIISRYCPFKSLLTLVLNTLLQVRDASVETRPHPVTRVTSPPPPIKSCAPWDPSTWQPMFLTWCAPLRRRDTLSPPSWWPTSCNIWRLSHFPSPRHCKKIILYFLSTLLKVQNSAFLVVSEIRLGGFNLIFLTVFHRHFTLVCIFTSTTSKFPLTGHFSGTGNFFSALIHRWKFTPTVRLKI
jgi:hypothetical protein